MTISYSARDFVSLRSSAMAFNCSWATRGSAGGGIEARFVGVTGVHRVGQCVVDLQGDPLGAVVTVIPLLILAADDGKVSMIWAPASRGVGKLALSRAGSSAVSPPAGASRRWARPGAITHTG